MKIKNIKINNYGNLENREIDFQDKINIIYGKNESGKSTLLSYIKNIFYGISKNKNGREISDYDRYKPWMKEEFSGKLKYKLDNGKNFEVFRDFNKKNPKIFNDNLEDISQNFNIDKKDGCKFFFDQTQVDENMFLSTVMSMQQEVKLDEQSQLVLIQKVANLAGTGNDNISFKKVIDKLNKRQVDEIGTERTQEKPINVIRNRMKIIEDSIKEIDLYKEEKVKLETRKKEVEEQIRELEIENNIQNLLNSVNTEIKLEEEKINIKNKTKIENKEKINKLKLEINDLTKNKEEISSRNKKIDTNNENTNNIGKKSKKVKYISIFFILLIICIIIKLINIYYLTNIVLDIISYVLIPIYLIAIYIKSSIGKNKTKKVNYEKKLKERLEEEQLKNQINIIDIQIESLNTQIEELIIENKQQENEIEDIRLKIENIINAQTENIKKQYSNKVDVDNIIEKMDFDNIQNELLNTQEEISKNKILLNSFQIEEKNIVSKLEDMISLKEEYEGLQEKLMELQEKSNCINLTKEYLNKAYEKMKSSVTPKFTENLSKNISEISDGKYNKVTINDESGMLIENKFGDYIQANRLSIGTIDQLYLSLRLSMIEEMSDEKMPIILDEAFAYYDDARLQNILEFLLKKSKEHQVIIFTCTKREQEILNKLEVEYNLVEL